jgi:hypothetical protein
MVRIKRPGALEANARLGLNCASVLATVDSESSDSHQRPSFPQVNSNPGPV